MKELENDLELSAMLSCTKSIELLDKGAKKRVVNYLISRFDLDVDLKKEESKNDAKPASNREEKTNKKKTSKQGARIAPKNLQSYKLLNDINLYPTDKENLKDFYGKYISKTFFENNLLYVFYLEKMLKVSEITVDHVYTCYKKTGQKVPGNLYQSLADTRKLKGWIDTKNMNDLKVSIQGENHVDHEMVHSEPSK